MELSETVCPQGSISFSKFQMKFEKQVIKSLIQCPLSQQLKGDLRF